MWTPKIKSQCKECDGKSVCEHGKCKYKCKLCGGKSVCEHQIHKYSCKECHGNGICIHGKNKRYCCDCDGNGMCEHKKRKSYCKTCGGSALCEHNKRKSYCKTCGGSALCKTPLCETRAYAKYNRYCLPCCIQVCPEIQVSKNYKSKEKDVTDRIINNYENFSWVKDKVIKDGCSKRRPDMLLDLGSHIIIVEVDENKHSSYDCSCENKRLMELSQDVGHHPIVFIRFNPDAYTDINGIRITSCWKLNKLGILTVPKTKEKEWNDRIAILISQIDYWIHNTCTKTIEIIELFY